MCRQLQRWLLFGSRDANSLVSSRIVLSYMEKIEADMASAHIMDVTMLFHTLLLIDFICVVIFDFQYG